MIISVSGKGGTGKTTVTSLILKALVENTDKAILLIDADPSTNVPLVLGLNLEKTVGEVVNKFRKGLEDGSLAYVAKDSLLEGWIYETLKETTRFDVLAMGRTEGEGCYCYVNSVLASIIDKIEKNYDIVLLDMEAGLEHLSRRTDHDVDLLLVITDTSKTGLETARRIKELTKEVHIKVGKILLIGNKFPPEVEDMLKREAEKIGLKVAGIVPVDKNVMTYLMEGKSLLDLPSDSPAFVSVKEICKRIGLI